MTTVTVTSEKERPLRPLLEAALENKLKLLQVAIEQTQERLRSFEVEYGLPSPIFVQRHENDEFPETLEYAEWVGEYRMLERLQEKAETLKGIRFEDRTLF